MKSPRRPGRVVPPSTAAGVPVPHETEPDHLERRTRELDVIQTLGRRAAGAQGVDELIAVTLVALRPQVPIELALATHGLSGTPTCAAHTTRPIRAELLNELAQRSTRMLQWTDTPAVRVVPLGDHDATLAARDRVDETELVTLPLERRGRLVGCLLVILARSDDRSATERLLFSAANQLSLHLERILAAREDEAQRFRTILDSMPQAVLLTDARWRVRQANRAADLLFRSLDLPLTQGLEGARKRLALDALVERLRAGDSRVVEGEARPSRDRVVTVTASPLAEGGRQEEDGLVLVLTDVTDRRRLQEQLAQAEKMSSLGLMISGVAHELNNPLTSILGYAQLLGMGAGDAEKTSRRVELLNRETERCQRIVHNLLSFARQRGPERGALSLNEVVESVLALMGYQLRVNDIEVQTELDGDLRPVHGDRHQLQQVLVNLIANAQHAIREHGQGGIITVRTVAGQESSRLEVEDTGPGIPADSRGRIFDPFFTTKGEGQGTGLGLSLVQGIVTSHDGTIEALPGRESGALLRVELPVSATRTEGGEAPRTAGARATRRGRVLVVDDEETLLRMVAEGLGEEGHAVSTARDGREALDLISRGSFDVIIANVKMPGMDGERLYEELRRDQPDLHRRFVLTSGDTVGNDAEDAARRTGVGLLRKPFDLERLRQTVRACLAGLAEE